MYTERTCSQLKKNMGAKRLKSLVVNNCLSLKYLFILGAGNIGDAAEKVFAGRGGVTRRDCEGGYPGDDKRRDIRPKLRPAGANPPWFGGGGEIQSEPYTLYFQSSNQGTYYVLFHDLCFFLPIVAFQLIIKNNF